MIDEIHATDVALIGDASIEPHDRLTALTGETGAGKSALLSAIKLLIGERASPDQVRDGSDSLRVEGRFFFRDDPGHPDGRVASRTVTAQGRSKCSLDGSMATVSQLANAIGSTVDLCGQHDHQRLLSVASHLPLLDSWARERHASSLAAYRDAWEERAAAGRELDRVLAARSESSARIDDARFAIGRIEEVDPAPGEYEELEELLPRLEHAETLRDAASQAREAVSGEGGALDALASAVSCLRSASRHDPALERLADAIEQAVFPLEDASSSLRGYVDSIDFDPGALQRADERMGELVGLMRAFGPRMEDVFARLEDARALVGLVDDSERLEMKARERVDRAESRLRDAADALGKARRASAPLFSEAVSGQMARLEMGGASLVVEVRELGRAQWGVDGADAVEFMYRPGPGLAARPFVKIASGGEVSRVMLAIKVVLGERDDVETLIFDEIDAGVGGSTARAVGAVLRDLSKTHQVLVVTHLAQIAAMADRQYVVSKGLSDADGLPYTHIEPVEGQDRVREIARMLSGDDSASSIEHARDLLAASA